METLLRYECKRSNSKLNQEEQIQKKKKKKRIEHGLEGRVFGSRKEQVICLLSRRVRLALGSAKTSFNGYQRKFVRS
jgi:hypothetical protein